MEPPSPKHEPKRKHVTTACVACRESKVKCNGATPTCSNCQSKGKECRYQAREDKRKLSLRVAIELLFGRVQQLSQFINAQSLDIPSMPPDDQETLSGILRTLGLPQVTTFQDKADNENSTLQGSTAQWLDQRLEPPHPDAEAQGMNVPDMPNLEDSRGGSHPAVRSLLELANAADNMGNINQNPSSWDWNLATGAISQESVVHPDCIPTGPAGQPFLRNASSSPQLSVSMEMPSCRPSLDDDGVSTTQSVDDLGDKLSDRVGTLHIRPGGHIRFYGSTSNFNLLDTPAASVTMNVHRTIRSDGVEHLERLGLNKDVPTKIEQHLMNLYFTWQDPSFHTVDRTMFEEAGVVWLDKGEDTSYYSEALKNAICALGAAFDTRHHSAFVTFPRSLADFFADRAKALLEIELDSPCVATIQALVLLSAHDIGCGRDARGWLFSGMAMRLSFNLGLHHDLKPYIAKGAVTTAEADLRQTVFWAAFVVDHVWSFYLGQPFRMSMKGVSLKKPGLTASFRSSKQWTPYVSPSAVQTFTPVVDCVDEVCIHQVLLFEAMAPLSDTLYGSEATSRSSLQEINSQTVAKLHHWKGNLPVGLEVDIENREATYLPHVILLHMQYYQSIIYAYRPCMSKSYTQPQRGPGPDSARKMCVDSASTIAQLLRLYEERYTFRRINIQAVAITFSAALLLVFASIFYYHQEGEEEILADLSICFRALDELAPSWDTAKRAREFLVQLQRHWERQTRPSTVTGTRDDTSSTGSWSFSGARKRARSSLPSSEQNNDGRPTRFREETGSSFRREHWADNGNNLDSRSSATYMAANFSTDIDFDWMLASSMEVMPGNWGNIFSVPSSPRMPAYLGR